MSQPTAATFEPRRTSQVGFKPLFRAILRHKLSVFGLAVIAGLVIMALFAPVIAPYSPIKQDLYRVLAGPSKAHWLGTEQRGPRPPLPDHLRVAGVAHRGGRRSPLFRPDRNLPGAHRRVPGGVDRQRRHAGDGHLHGLPGLVFVLALSAALGPGVKNIIISLIVLGWTGFARIIRGQVLVVRELPYVEAARAAGASNLRIMLRHVLPNSVAPIIVAFSITIGAFIMWRAARRFSGSGRSRRRRAGAGSSAWGTRTSSETRSSPSPRGS